MALNLILKTGRKFPKKLIQLKLQSSSLRQSQTCWWAGGKLSLTLRASCFSSSLPLPAPGSLLGFPCSGLLATWSFRWPPGCAGRRNSERSWGKTGKRDGDLEGPKNHTGVGFIPLSACGKKGWILAVRPYWNMVGLINMVTSYHRCSHVCLKDLGRLRQLQSLLSHNLSCVALEHFGTSIKWTLSNLPHNTRSFLGSPHIWIL